MLITIACQCALTAAQSIWLSKKLYLLTIIFSMYATGLQRKLIFNHCILAMNGLLTNLITIACQCALTAAQSIWLSKKLYLLTIIFSMYATSLMSFTLICLRLSLWWNRVTRTTPHAIERMALCCNSIIVGLNSRSTAVVLNGVNLNTLTHMSILVYVGNFRLFSSILQNVQKMP